MKAHTLIVLSFAFGFIVLEASTEQCGRQAKSALCPNGLCCSEFGFCGDTAEYCGVGCQSQCGSNSSSEVGKIITSDIFDQMLMHRRAAACPSKGFYTYNAFIAAAQSFPGFGTTGDDATRRRELAAFFGQTSHETTGGWPSAPDGPYAWGYCFIDVGQGSTDCIPDKEWPCVAGQKYYARGPIQLTYNYNYGPAGKALSLDLLANPDLVATDPVVSFKTAIWFWMLPQSPQPSSHDVITGRWRPSISDMAVGRVPGYGLITNIISHGLECGYGPNSKATDRIGFYKRYCDILHVGYGNNVDCNNQHPFGRFYLPL